MMRPFKIQNAIQRTIRSIWSLVLVAGAAAGCTTEKVRMNVVSQQETLAPRTIQIEASSSIDGRSMGDDLSLRERVATAFQKQFPDVRLVQSQPDMVVFFTIVDYAPGCSPNCKKFKTYRNWSCEVMIYPTDSHPEAHTIVFNLEGSTYNPFYNPASNCASQLSKVSRGGK
jgi:hypothetical protein